MQLTIPIPDAQQVIRLPAGIVDRSEDDFFRFCVVNSELRIERTAKGEIIVMSPAGGHSGYQSGEAFRQLSNWALKDNTGVAFDSSTGFLLPNGAMRSPDAAWVKLSRLAKLTLRESKQFIPLCPDFLIEVASPSDSPAALREKMEEYRATGLELGWAILPESQRVEVYTPSDIEVLNSPQTLSGSPVLAGFTLDLSPIWNPPF